MFYISTIGIITIYQIFFTCFIMIIFNKPKVWWFSYEDAIIKQANGPRHNEGIHKYLSGIHDAIMVFIFQYYNFTDWLILSIAGGIGHVCIHFHGPNPSRIIKTYSYRSAHQRF